MTGKRWLLSVGILVVGGLFGVHLLSAPAAQPPGAVPAVAGRYVYTSVGLLDTATGKAWTLKDVPGGEKAGLPKKWVPLTDSPQ